MTTRVTEGARRERFPPSFLAFRGFAAQHSRGRALPLLNLKKKRDCSPSRFDVGGKTRNIAIQPVLRFLLLPVSLYLNACSIIFATHHLLFLSAHKHWED